MNDTAKPVGLVELTVTVDELQVLVDALEEEMLWLDNNPSLDSLVAKVYAVMDEVGRR